MSWLTSILRNWHLHPREETLAGTVDSLAKRLKTAGAFFCLLVSRHSCEFPMSTAYMLLFRDSTPEVYEAMTTSQREAALRDWNAWHDGLAAAGKVQHAHPLEPGGRVVSAPRGGGIKDGPFLEAKEAIGGYFFLTVDSLDEATEIARNCPNLKNGMVVEVRPVSGACPLAQSLGLQTMR